MAAIMNAQTVPVVIETSIAEYSQTAAALADLNKRYKGVVYDVTTTKGMDAAKRGRQEILGYRTALENKRKEIKAPALDLCRRIDSDAQRITAALVELEYPIDATIKAEEAKKEAERQVKIEAERSRISELQNKLSTLTNMPATLMGSSSESMLTALEALSMLKALEALRLRDTSMSVFSEFSGQAVEAKQTAVKTLEAMLSAQLVYEAAQRKIAAEREAVQRQKIEAERRAAAEIIAEGQRKAKAQQDELDRQAQTLRDEQDRAAREQQAREKAEADAARKKEEVASRAKVNEKMAADEMLRTFLDKYGAKKEFSYVVFAINQYFN